MPINTSYGYLGPALKSGAVVIKSFIKSPDALADHEILKFAEIAQKTGGTKIIGKELGKRKLSNQHLEDIYMRIAVQQSKISRVEAEQMFNRLTGKPGFRSTLSKVIGASAAKTSGHLYELRIADKAVQYGADLQGIGVRFDDGIKAGVTDIDVLFKLNGSHVAIEAKDYLATTQLPLDKFRGDMVSLAQYAKSNVKNKTIKVFALSRLPNDSASYQLLQAAARKQDVELIVGSPEELLLQIKQLQAIL